MQTTPFLPMDRHADSFKALYHVRVEKLKQKLSTLDKDYLLNVDVQALGADLWRRFALPEIEQRGEIDIRTRQIPGYDKNGRVSPSHSHVAIVVKIPVHHEELIPQLLEASRRRIYSPATNLEYHQGIISLGSVVEENYLAQTIEHLRADVEKRNRLIRTENLEFHRQVNLLIMSARNHYWRQRPRN